MSHESLLGEKMPKREAMGVPRNTQNFFLEFKKVLIAIAKLFSQDAWMRVVADATGSAMFKLSARKTQRSHQIMLNIESRSVSTVVEWKSVANCHGVANCHYRRAGKKSGRTDRYVSAARSLRRRESINSSARRCA
jgi:hypothetical protein